MTRTKTKRRTQTQRELLPTEADAARYIRLRRLGRPKPVRATGRAITPAPPDRDSGPELVLALERAAEFPRLIEQYDEGDWENRSTWRFDVRLDLVNGQRLYRCWPVDAANRDEALAALLARAGGVATVTVFAIRPPPTLAQIDEIGEQNRRLRQVRARRRGDHAGLRDPPAG
jgi:hypothetical protein